MVLVIHPEMKMIRGPCSPVGTVCYFPPQMNIILLLASALLVLNSDVNKVNFAHFLDSYLSEIGSLLNGNPTMEAAASSSSTTSSATGPGDNGDDAARRILEAALQVRYPVQYLSPVKI